jgi:hypothetical protein
MPAVPAIPDPRPFPDPAVAGPAAARLYALADESLAATTGQIATARDAEIEAGLARLLAAHDGAGLAALLDGAPSVAVGRHLWRLLAKVFTAATRRGGGGAALTATVFALPVVVVAAIEGGGRDSRLTLPCVLDDAAALAAILRDHGALGGNRTVGFANVLCGADAIDTPALPRILAWQGLTEGSEAGVAALPEVPPLPIAIAGTGESVYLRMLVGRAVAAPGVDLLASTEVGGWGTPLAHALSRQLAVPGASVLALPRAPQAPLAAVRAGRIAQREVGAQLFAGNAIRRIRAAVGEPTAVISAHRVPDAPGGGELRLSLSSPLDPREAEGFRCPLYPLDRPGDVATMLVDLLRDCRVADIRVLSGVHADRVPGTGQLLLFKPETIPGGDAGTLH